MADYISKHTGPQIDAAVEKTSELDERVTELEKVFIITVTQPAVILDGDTSGITADKTFAEINAAINAGKTPVVRLKTQGKLDADTLHLYKSASLSIVFRQQVKHTEDYNIVSAMQCTFIYTGAINVDSVNFRSVPDNGTDGQVLVHKGESNYEWRDPSAIAGIAPAIIPTATGVVVTIPDSAERPLAGLRLYGKTTQDGTPTPDAPVPLVNVGAGGSIGVKASGKNLAEIVSSASVGSQYGTMATIRPFKLLAGITYTLSFDTQNTGIECYINPNSLGIYRQFVMDGSRKSFAFYHDADRDMIVEGDGISYLVSRSSATSDVSSGVISNVQIEIGNTATAFEPYVDGGSLAASTSGGFAGIPSGGGMLCDYTEYGLATHVQWVQRIVLNGSENITYNSDAFNVPGVIQSGGRAYMQGMCSHYPVATNYNEFISGDYCVCNWSNDALRIRHGGNTDVASFKAWLASNPVTLYFPLPTPRYTTVSYDEMAAYRAMKTLKPHTVVYNDAGAAMHVDYIADTRNYIDQRIAAISAALLNK